jgi:type VI protein secretion system component VasF
MGELLGVPEWLAATGFVVIGLALWIGLGVLLRRRAHACLAARRPNPTEDEFLAMMAQD